MQQDSLNSEPLDPKFTQRLRTIRDALLTGLVERDVAIRLALIASLAGEHLLLLGPPGTAKSLVARRLRLAFTDATYFERLLTRFTVPEELFGPLSIKGLEDDRYERLTNSYLPSAAIAFLDEIFKANSAILNSLLTLLNEREFDNGNQRVKTPLIAVIGASNELPEGDELDALFDRFLLRLHVGPVSQEAFPELLGLRGNPLPEVPDSLQLTTKELETVQSLAEQVTIPEDIVILLCELRNWCMAEGIQISDRRWRKIVKLLQVAALTNGRDRVSIWDGWLLQHCLWDKPENREKIYSWYADRVGTSAAMDTSRLTKIITSWESKLTADRESRSQVRDQHGKPLYQDSKGQPTPLTKAKVQRRRDGEPLFLCPEKAYDPNPRHNFSGEDRTNKGKGCTEQELNKLNMISGGYFEYWKDRDSYLADKNNWLLEEVDLLPLMEPTRHKPIYIECCLNEINDLKKKIQTYSNELHGHIASMDRDIRDHLWITPDFLVPASKNLDQTRQEVETLTNRVEKIRKGFELLPQEKESSLPNDQPPASPRMSSKKPTGR